MGQNVEWDKISNGTKCRMEKRRMGQNVNEKTLNGTKRRIENRKEKYINIFGFLLLLLSDYIGTITY